MKRQYLGLATILMAIAWPNVAGADPIWDRLTVQQTLDSKLTPKPAFLQISFPRGAPKTYQVSAAVKYGLLQTAFIELAPFIEYQRNTETEKEQNFLKAGATLDWTSGDLVQQPWALVVLAEVNYARDGLKDASSAQASLLVTPIFRGCGMRPQCIVRPNVRSLILGMAVLWAPYIGIEDAETFTAPTGSPTGGETRLSSRIDLALYPASTWLDDRIELIGSFAYRYELRDDIEEMDASHPLWQASLNIYFVKDDKRSAGIGIDYERGEDPSRGFENQEVVRVALKAKL